MILSNKEVLALLRIGLEEEYPAAIRMPNGCDLTPGGRIRMARAQIWEIPQNVIDKYGLELDHDAASHGSEVVTWPVRLEGEIDLDIANTEPRPVSTSLAVAKRVKASEGPERDGHKPLMRNQPFASISFGA